MDSFRRDGLTFDVRDSGPSTGDAVVLLASADSGAPYEHLLYRAIGVFEAHEVVRPELLQKLAAQLDYSAEETNFTLGLTALSVASFFTSSSAFE